MVINSRKKEACDDVVKTIKALGRLATTCAFDVTDEAAVVKGFKTIKKKLGESIRDKV